MKVFARCIKKPTGTDEVQIDTYPTAIKTIIIGNIQITHQHPDYTFLLEQSLDVTKDELGQLQDPEFIYTEGTAPYKIIDGFRKAFDQVLGYIKYFSFIPQLDEKLGAIGMAEWSLDNKNWEKVPMKFNSKWIPGGWIYTLHQSFLEWIPDFIKTNVTPFFSYVHLHKALSEKDTRHQWINATIAAELAFKEFLGILKPEVITLLSYLPSPPLSKMYKNILKDYTGEESPVYKSLAKGAEIRNTLVHKPGTVPPTRHETEKYLLEVNLAIMHLQYLCYPKSDGMIFLYQKAKHQVDNFKPS